MRTRTEVSPAKLRGGFYSPPSLVRACFEKIESLVGDARDLRLLEPAAGDGAFIRGLATTGLQSRVEFVEAIELSPSEASEAAAALLTLGTPGAVYAQSFLEWPARDHGSFDVAVGNPPFLRFQFLSEEDKAALPSLGTALGVSFNGVSNLWIPIFLIAISRLREGGSFAFVVPAELFTGISANTVRKWLCTEATDLEAQLFPPGSFPGVLQEVIILSGHRRHGGQASLTLVETTKDGRQKPWRHTLDSEASTWTRYLLPPAEHDAYAEASNGLGVRYLGEIAKFEVAAVTGANDFFSVSPEVVDTYALEEWVRPLLPRARLAPGLRYTLEDHKAATDSGARIALLDFSSELSDPLAAAAPRKYLEGAEAAGLHRRFKTRTRTPWYRVPHIRPGRLMLSKRSHRYPRLILNDAGVVTTDTIYRGWMRADYEGREEDLVAVFHNSLTLLSAEIEGRSFGGGVLELVPSEINRLAVPFVNGAGVELDRIAANVVVDGEITDRLVERTDELLVRHGRFTPEVLDQYRSARRRLQARRLERTTNPASYSWNGHAA